AVSGKEELGQAKSSFARGEPLARARRLFKVAGAEVESLALPQQRADHLLDQHRPRIHPIEIAVVIIIAVVGIERVAPAQVVRDSVIAVQGAVTRVPLAAIELLRLTRRHAAVVLFGKTRRTAADAIADTSAIAEPLGIAMAVTIAVSVALGVAMA